MMQPRPIDRVLLDRRLLGAGLLDDSGNDSWATWLAGLRAAFALPLTDADRTIFSAISGGRTPPTRRVRELWCVVGRGGGKSKISAALGVYQGCFVKHKLSPGETGYVLILAMSRAQATVIFNYALAYLQSSPVLAQEIASTTATEIRLHNGIIIAVHPNSFRSVRGRTLVAVIFDEVSFWRDETSATPDLEVYRAVLPSLIRTKGMLIGISTPYRKLGLLYQNWHDHYGQCSADVLVVHGPSIKFNPTLSEQDIQAALAADPEGNISEWEAEFRMDLSAFLDDATVEAAIDYGRPLELPPRQGIQYRAFADPSGGRHDAFTLCIGHQEGETHIVDVVRGKHPPFDPHEVVAEYAALLREYRVDTLSGDNYSAAWVEAAFQAVGIKYQRADKPKSQLYLEALPLFMRRAIRLPSHPKLIRELKLLERRAGRTGKDTVDHGKHGSDDYANCVVGMLTQKGKAYAWQNMAGTPEEDAAAWRRMGYLRSQGMPV
jgi:hypothetical protein